MFAQALVEAVDSEEGKIDELGDVRIGQLPSPG